MAFLKGVVLFCLLVLASSYPQPRETDILDDPPPPGPPPPGPPGDTEGNGKAAVKSQKPIIKKSNASITGNSKYSDMTKQEPKSDADLIKLKSALAKLTEQVKDYTEAVHKKESVEVYHDDTYLSPLEKSLDEAVAEDEETKVGPALEVENVPDISEVDKDDSDFDEISDDMFPNDDVPNKVEIVHPEIMKDVPDKVEIVHPEIMDEDISDEMMDDELEMHQKEDEKSRKVLGAIKKDMGALVNDFKAMKGEVVKVSSDEIRSTYKSKLDEVKFDIDDILLDFKEVKKHLAQEFPSTGEFQDNDEISPDDGALSHDDMTGLLGDMNDMITNARQKVQDIRSDAKQEVESEEQDAQEGEGKGKEGEGKGKEGEGKGKEGEGKGKEGEGEAKGAKKPKLTFKKAAKWLKRSEVKCPKDADKPSKRCEALKEVLTTLKAYVDCGVKDPEAECQGEYDAFVDARKDFLEKKAARKERRGKKAGRVRPTRPTGATAPKVTKKSGEEKQDPRKGAKKSKFTSDRAVRWLKWLTKKNKDKCKDPTTELCVKGAAVIQKLQALVTCWTATGVGKDLEDAKTKCTDQLTEMNAARIAVHKIGREERFANKVKGHCARNPQTPPTDVCQASAAFVACGAADCSDLRMAVIRAVMKVKAKKAEDYINAEKAKCDPTDDSNRCKAIVKVEEAHTALVACMDAKKDDSTKDCTADKETAKAAWTAFKTAKAEEVKAQVQALIAAVKERCKADESNSDCTLVDKVVETHGGFRDCLAKNNVTIMKGKWGPCRAHWKKVTGAWKAFTIGLITELNDKCKTSGSKIDQDVCDASLKVSDTHSAFLKCKGVLKRRATKEKCGDELKEVAQAWGDFAKTFKAAYGPLPTTASPGTTAGTKLPTTPPTKSKIPDEGSDDIAEAEGEEKKDAKKGRGRKGSGRALVLALMAKVEADCALVPPKRSPEVCTGHEEVKKLYGVVKTCRDKFKGKGWAAIKKNCPSKDAKVAWADFQKALTAEEREDCKTDPTAAVCKELPKLAQAHGDFEDCLKEEKEKEESASTKRAMRRKNRPCSTERKVMVDAWKDFATAFTEGTPVPTGTPPKVKPPTGTPPKGTPPTGGVKPTRPTGGKKPDESSDDIAEAEDADIDADELLSLKEELNDVVTEFKELKGKLEKRKDEQKKQESMSKDYFADDLTDDVTVEDETLHSNDDLLQAYDESEDLF